MGALWEFYKSYLADFLIFIPFIVAGVTHCLTKKTNIEDEYYLMRGLLSALVTVPILFLLMMKNAPFPRNFVPLIPLVSLVMAVSVAHVLKVMENKEWVRAFPLTLALVVLCLVFKLQGWGCEKFAKLDSQQSMPYVLSA